MDESAQLVTDTKPRGRRRPHPESSTDLVQHSQARLTHAEEIKILRLVKIEGLSQTVVAKAMNRAESTISDCLKRYEDTGDLALQVLKSNAAAAAENWAAIAKTSTRHEAAKDLLLHAGVIQPLEQSGTGTKVQILIGQPGAPLAMQVIDSDTE
jgi:IS30 family transposase